MRSPVKITVEEATGLTVLMTFLCKRCIVPASAVVSDRASAHNNNKNKNSALDGR